MEETPSLNAMNQHALSGFRDHDIENEKHGESSISNCISVSKGTGTHLKSLPLPSRLFGNGKSSGHTTEDISFKSGVRRSILKLSDRICRKGEIDKEENHGLTRSTK